MKKLFRKIQPANIYRDEGLIEKENINIGWFDFKSPTMDVALLNIMYCANCNGKTLQGVFNAPYSDWQIWKPIMIEVVKSIEVV